MHMCFRYAWKAGCWNRCLLLPPKVVCENVAVNALTLPSSKLITFSPEASPDRTGS